MRVQHRSCQEGRLIPAEGKRRRALRFALPQPLALAFFVNLLGVPGADGRGWIGADGHRESELTPVVHSTSVCGGALPTKSNSIGCSVQVPQGAGPVRATAASDTIVEVVTSAADTTGTPGSAPPNVEG